MNSPRGKGRTDGAVSSSIRPRPLVVFTGVVVCLTLLSNYEQFIVETKSFDVYRSQSVYVAGSPEGTDGRQQPSRESREEKPEDVAGGSAVTDDEADVPVVALKADYWQPVPVEYSAGVSILPNRTLSNALSWSGDARKIRVWSDLPRVFDFDPKSWSKEGKARVCVYTRTPRQDSLFKSNIIAQFGSQKYFYEILHSKDCQHNGVCKSAEDARSHPRCNGATTRTVHLLERIKCCQHDRYDRVLSKGMEYYDVLVATGDEYCRAVSSIGRAHFRTYAGDGVTRSAKLEMGPEYLPLGPREEFFRVRPQHIVLSKDRPYLFNFIGSVTSTSRKYLGRQLRGFAKQTKGQIKSFVHIVGQWSKKLTKSNGYILPGEYRRVLMNSSFTLCPQGHNPEAYRIYEAAEAGSIPILVLDSSYKSHECKCSFKPLIDSGAPFVFLEHWGQLPSFLFAVQKDPLRIQRMQANVMNWYSKFMRRVALNFETILEARFQDRIEHGKFTSTASFNSVTTLLE